MPDHRETCLLYTSDVYKRQGHMSTTQFDSEESEKQFPQPQPVPGLGDSAFELSGPELLNGRTITIGDVIVLEGRVVVSVEGPATVERLQALAGSILPKL